MQTIASPRRRARKNPAARPRSTPRAAGGARQDRGGGKIEDLQRGMAGMGSAEKLESIGKIFDLAAAARTHERAADGAGTPAAPGIDSIDSNPSLVRCLKMLDAFRLKEVLADIKAEDWDAVTAEIGAGIIDLIDTRQDYWYPIAADVLEYTAARVRQVVASGEYTAARVRQVVASGELARERPNGGTLDGTSEQAQVSAALRALSELPPAAQGLISLHAESEALPEMLREALCSAFTELCNLDPPIDVIAAAVCSVARTLAGKNAAVQGTQKRSRP